MFVINDDLSIFLTQGDAATITLSIYDGSVEKYIFKVGDVIRFKVF